jgi:Cu+-exporting ATPase
MYAAPQKDPVCGMTVTEDSPLRHQHEGRTSYFCSETCRAKFAAEPLKYVAPESAPVPVPAQAATVYVCPMHPEVRQDRQGTCPKCGKALEPELPSVEDEGNPELTDFRRRFWWTLPLTIIVTVLAMFGHQLGWFDMATQSWIELVLSVPVVLWAGWPFFVRGAQSIANRSPNMWADRNRNRLGVRVQRRRDRRARCVPGLVRLDGTGGGELRGRRCHHLADLVGAAP